MSVRKYDSGGKIEDDSDGMTLILSPVKPWVRSVQGGLSALEGERQEIGRQANNRYKYVEFNTK